MQQQPPPQQQRHANSNKTHQNQMGIMVILYSKTHFYDRSTTNTWLAGQSGPRERKREHERETGGPRGQRVLY